MSKTSQATLRKVKRHDLLARWVVTLGGVVVIGSVVGILVMILGTTVPLFLPARARLLAEATLPMSVKAEGVLGLGIEATPDDRWQIAHLVDASGRFHIVNLATGKVIQELVAEAAEDHSARNTGAQQNKVAVSRRVLAADSSGTASFTLRWSDGSISLVDVVALPRGKQADGYVPRFVLKTRAVIPVDKLGVPITAVMRSQGEKSSACAAAINSIPRIP